MKSNKVVTAKSKSIWKDKNSWHLLLLCIPGLIGYLLFNYVPMISAVVIPFKEYKFSKGIWGSEWIGLKNFSWIMSSASLQRALRNTLLYGLFFMFFTQIVNAGLAILLYEVRSRRALKIFQTTFSFPNFMSYVIVGYISYAVLAPSNGFMNSIITALGGSRIDVYSKPAVWPLILVIVNTWKSCGMGSLMYFANLMGIDSALFEAAEIDGASRWQRIRYISIPHLLTLMCIYLIMGAKNLIGGDFDLFYVIPKNIGLLYPTTDILDTYVYRALAEGTYAMGATVGILQSVVGLILVVAANVAVKKISPEKSMF